MTKEISSYLNRFGGFAERGGVWEVSCMMKMPAQYACVAENEMMYLDGGATVRLDLDDFSWKQLGENWFKSVGNKFLSKALNSMFDFDWVLPSFNFFGSSSSTFGSDEVSEAQEQMKQSFVRAGQFMVQTLGFVAALYVLGTGAAKVRVSI